MIEIFYKSKGRILSSADMVLSIKTGKMVTFIGLTLAIVLIIGTSAYFIKKKVLR